MDGLLARIDILDQANTRWTSTVVPLLERFSRQLVSTSTSSSAGNAGGARLGYYPEAGAGAGSSVNDLTRSQSQSSALRSGTVGLGPSYYDRGGVFTPTRLGSIARLDNCDLEEKGKRRYRRSKGVDASCSGGGGGDGRRERDCRVAEDGITKDKSWSRNNSSVHAGYLGSSSTDVVSDAPPYCRGALMPPDGTLSGFGSGGSSGDSSEGDNDRETAFPERQTKSCVKQQQPESGNLPPETQEGGDPGDATGLGALEGLMRELIQTARLRN